MLGRLFFLAILFLFPWVGFAQPYLSNLSADKDDPLYATYAAPMHRSQFVLDEGYQFKFYLNGNGIDFETDNAGELGLAFKLGGEVRYKVEDMYRQPEITTSYPDIVHYNYEPFAGISVNAVFQVYSSRLALQDIEVVNGRDSAVTLDVYPFLHHPEGIDSIRVASDKRYFTFNHQEPPDGWTRSHGVPYIEDVKNLLILNEAPSAFGGYTDLGQPTDRTQAKNYYEAANEDLPDENYAVEWGRVYNADGSDNTRIPPQTRQIILHNGSGDEILTEKAPKWGETDPNIPGNGYQGAELGNFQHPEIEQGDTFTVIFTDLVSGAQGSVSGTIPDLPAEGGINVDPIYLTDQSYPPRPEDFQVSMGDSETTAEIRWVAESDLSYDLYRRTESRKGRFDRIAEGLTDDSYADFNLSADSSYIYTLIARDSQGRRSPHTIPRGETGRSTLFSDIQGDRLSNVITEQDGNVAAFQLHWDLESGSSQSFRLVRGVDPMGTPTDSLLDKATPLFEYDWRQDITRNEQLYSSIPLPDTDDPDKRLMYWNAYTLMRQVFYPPANLTDYNYYVFSREPTWGWGHGGQVFHESLAMHAYVFMDGESAQNSQRVYMERQHDNGYIDYRSGGYLSEQIPNNGELTTSAPWFNWENWTIYRETGDRQFLNEAYSSGRKFYNFWLENRDKDSDGLMEWGGVAVLEAVRDGLVAAWQVGDPQNFESLALNSMLVKEARSLGKIAAELGDSAAANRWRQRADTLGKRVNSTFWDEESGFYYMVDRQDHDFTFNTDNDLKRQEIIGFLPLWAGIASREQAEELVEKLTDENKFWRNHGIPSLAADDPYYDHAGYWNGPVWVQWEYLIFRGLLNYGYDELARMLAEKVFDKVIFHLKRDHTFWEMYSPDNEWAGHHQTYIWTGIVARMMLDLQREETAIKGGYPRQGSELPDKVQLDPNAPNPFNPTTTLTYRLPHAQTVDLTIYNVLGQKVANLVKNRRKSAGVHRHQFNANDLSSGVYVYRLQTPHSNLSRKMMIMK